MKKNRTDKKTWWIGLFMAVIMAGTAVSCSDSESEKRDETDDTTAVCGDGNGDHGEACDDGNNTDGDDCSASCAAEDEHACTDSGVCPPNDAENHILEHCGDGVLDDDETCDDGNNTDGDGCSSACLKEKNAFYVPNPGPETKCNDRKHEAGEVCDPAYSYSLDGETRSCEVTSDGKCVLSLSTGGKSNCGTGTLEPGEECDDGNTANGDGCSNKCKVEASSVCRMKNGAHGTILLVVDGDTLKIRLDNGDCTPSGALTIRLHGIDTPECAKENRPSSIDAGYSASAYIKSETYNDKNERGGYEASVFVEELIYSQENNGVVEIECETRSDTDPTCLLDATNGRYLAYIKLKKEGKYVDLANELVKAGYAMVYTDFTSQRLEKYCSSEKEAISSKTGFWSYASTFEEAIKLLSSDKQRYMTNDHCN